MDHIITSPQRISNNDYVVSHQPCPKCLSSDAYSEYADGHGWCFSCKTYFNGNRKGFHVDDFTYEYLPRRNISEHTHKFYDVRTKIDTTGKPVAVGYPYSDEVFKIRLLDKKEFYTEGEINKAGLFGKNRFASGAYSSVTITEGEDDAMALYQVLRSPVVSVQSSSTAARDCALDRDWLNAYDKIYLAFDNDGPGKEAARQVARLFDYNKIYHVKFSNRKDATEYLEANETEELKKLWQNARRYLPDNIISSFKEFKDILDHTLSEGVPYPFPTLNSMLHGIRPSESVLITAQEGVGKTELMHAIEYQLLRETKDAVGSIFLEEPKGQHLQRLAGLHLKAPVHIPGTGYSQDQVFAAIQDLVQEDDRLHIYNHFGSDDPLLLVDTIRFLVTARSCRYILLDHITMVVSTLAGEDERLALDHLSTRLEMLVKELDFSLIFVSHVNDDGKTRGSRMISKICDIRIDASRDLLNSDLEIRNTMFLNVSKNRPIGKTGPAGKLIFNPVLRTYSEELSYGEQLRKGKTSLLETGVQVRREGQEEESQVHHSIPANDNMVRSEVAA